MYRISVTLFLVGFLIGAITAADDQPDCGAQYFDQFKCMMAIKESDEIKAIMEKKKPILQTCAPDYPKSCIEEWETMESCCKKIISQMGRRSRMRRIEKRNDDQSEYVFRHRTARSNGRFRRIIHATGYEWTPP